MKNLILLFAVFILFYSTQAGAVVEPDFTPDLPPAVTLWYGSVGLEEKAADMNFISGMRPHHAGALTMSEQYLAHKQAKNTQLIQLARGIIHNQEFEIFMLDTVKTHLDKLKPAEGQTIKGVIATKGLAQKHRFVRAPRPGFTSRWGGETEVTQEDVRFAKAMIIHHQAALDMAHEYLADPHAKNGYLELMCLDILRDQQQEIDFMNAIIAQYKGNPNSVKIDPSMVHGMQGMKHNTKSEPSHHRH
jgi:uncharacterized protein (DUF305 family)